jgi:peptide/nickel transport system substrate-binding protein
MRYFTLLLCTMFFGVGLSQSIPNDIIVVGIEAEPTSLDPQQVTDINTMRVLSNLYDTLVHMSAEGFEPQPGMAQSWDISDDGLEYTFELREGLTFHDGTPVDAAAVEFTFERMLDPEHPYADTGPFPFAATYFSQVETVEAVDPLTVRFTLAEPFSAFLGNLSSMTAAIISPTALEEFGADFSQRGVGSGPYQLASWERGSRVVLEANANYWEGAPPTPQAVFVPIVDNVARVVALQSGQLNIAVNIQPDSIAGLEEDPRFEVLQQVGPHIWWITLDMNNEHLADKRVRQALNYAIDREAITNDILKGTGVPAYGPIPPGLAGYDPELTSYTYDPERARELLAEAGFADGFTIDLWVPTSGSGMQEPVPMGTAIQAYWADIGVNARINTLDWGTYLSNLAAPPAESGYTTFELSFMLGTGEPDILISTLLSTEQIAPAGINTGGYSNPEVDRLAAEARRELDASNRAELYRQIANIIIEDAPWVFVDHWKQSAAITSDVQGFELTQTFLLPLKNVSKQ